MNAYTQYIVIEGFDPIYNVYVRLNSLFMGKSQNLNLKYVSKGDEWNG